MDKSLKKTIYGLIVITLVLFLAGVLLFKTFLAGYYFPFFPFLILFFFLVNLGFFIFFHKTLKKSPSQFIRSFMLITGAKLVIIFMLVLIYMISSPETAIPFAVTLGVIYIIYTAFDLIVTLSLLNRKKENSHLSSHLSN